MRTFVKTCVVAVATAALVGTAIQAPAAVSWYSRVVDRPAPAVSTTAQPVQQATPVGDAVAPGLSASTTDRVATALAVSDAGTDRDAAEASAVTEDSASEPDAPVPAAETASADTFGASDLDLLIAAPVTSLAKGGQKADRTRTPSKGQKPKQRVAPAVPGPSDPVDPPADPEQPPASDPAEPPAPPAYTGRWFGFYVPGTPSNGLDSLAALESKLGAQAGVVNFFIADSESFPASRCQAVANHGAVPMVTLEFWSTQNGGLAAIANGSKDQYLYAFADAARAYGGEVYLRPFHEMNGNWYPWSGTVGSNDAGDLVAAWRRVENIFDARGADNVKFVWCVNNDSVPNTSANSWTKYYPGDNYVDFVSIDGYNWGTTASWSSWRSFSSCFDAPYQAITAITGKPMLIGETSCVEQGGSKAAWITDMFAKIESRYTRIVGVCWFSADKERDWRVESSTTSLNAYKAAMAKGY